MLEHIAFLSFSLSWPSQLFFSYTVAAIFKTLRKFLYCYFRDPTDEQLGVDIFFSNYNNLQSVYFELGMFQLKRKIIATKGRTRTFRILISLPTRQKPE